MTNNHRLDQLVNRIEKQGLGTGHYRNANTGQCCVIGHMMDMAGILDEVRIIPNRIGEDINQNSYTFAESGRYIDSHGMERASTTLTEHFGLSVSALRELQHINDNYGDKDVIDFINTFDL